MRARLTIWGRFTALAAILLVFGLLHPLHAQSPETPPSAEKIEIVKQRLAALLGLDAAALKPQTDLVGDLGLDQTAVYYAVTQLLSEASAPALQAEVTVIADIARLLEPVAAAPRRATRSFRAPPPASPPPASPPPPAPSASRSAQAAPVEAAQSYLQRVYYATNRKATGGTSPDNYFSGARSDGGKLAYGYAEVNIPLSHKPGQIETPWFQLQSLREAGKHIYIQTLTPQDEGGFFQALGGSSDAKSDVLVYVHGFNTAFNNAVVRAAQISVDFGFKGAPIVFSWPSDGQITSYNSDSEDVLWSAKHIEVFLRAVAEKTKGRRLHLVAHSMGTKGLLNALRLSAYRGQKTPLFASVILCAPDFDAGLFREQIAEEVRPLARQWVVYSSKKDFALMASEQLNAGTRLGTPFTIANGYEIIDASEVEVTPWSVPETHSYYATKKTVLDDMVKVLQGLPAKERGLKARVSIGGVVWTFTPGG